MLDTRKSIDNWKKKKLFRFSLNRNSSKRKKERKKGEGNSIFRGTGLKEGGKIPRRRRCKGKIVSRYTLIANRIEFSPWKLALVGFTRRHN